MDKFELLEREIVDICNIHNIQFSWRYDDILGSYILRFNKLDKGFKLIINKLDIHIKPFIVIKTEIEHDIYEIIGY